MEKFINGVIGLALLGVVYWWWDLGAMPFLKYLGGLTLLSLSDKFWNESYPFKREPR